jgi:hypothetical protein
MQEEQIRTALNARGHSSAIGDANAEHDICDVNPRFTSAAGYNDVPAMYSKFIRSQG